MKERTVEIIIPASTIKNTVYVAEDGSEFSKAQDCYRYEGELLYSELFRKGVKRSFKEYTTSK